MGLWNKSPHFAWNSWPQPRIWPRSSLIYGEGTWQKPPFRVWPCRPWWTWPKMIKFAWEYAVVHYSKSSCPKNTRKFWSNFFFSQNFQFFRVCKNCRKLEKIFFLFFVKKKIILLGTVIPDKTSSNKSKLDQNQSILRHFRPKNGHISNLGMFTERAKKVSDRNLALYAPLFENI